MESRTLDTTSFAGLELARRLERAEGAASAAFVEAHRRLSPASGAIWTEVAGAYAMFDGPDSPLTQTFGLGVFSPPSPGDLDLLEEFFHSRGALVSHELCPLAGVELASTLAGRGYLPIEFTSVLFRPVDSPPSANPRIAVHRLAPGEEQLWSETSARAWSAEHPELHGFLLDLGRIIASADGAVPFLATLDGRPVATASLRCDDGIALFAGASTIPEARNQGAQRALLEARMRHASAVGCQLAMMCAAPGSASQRNAERQGFRIAYTRTKWSLAPR